MKAQNQLVTPEIPGHTWSGFLLSVSHFAVKVTSALLLLCLCLTPAVPTANAAEDDIVVSVVPPPPFIAYEAKTKLSVDMMEYRDTEMTNEQDAAKLDEAIDALLGSLDSSLWLADGDGNHLNPKRGDRVFRKESISVGKLELLIEQSPEHAQFLLGFIDTMVGVDRWLAQTAIGDAVGGSPRKIVEATNEITKGDADRALGKPREAIEHYRLAWKKVQ